MTGDVGSSSNAGILIVGIVQNARLIVKLANEEKTYVYGQHTLERQKTGALVQNVAVRAPTLKDSNKV